MKTLKKSSKDKDKKSFSYRLGEIFGGIVGAVIGTFTAPPSSLDARNELEKKGKARLKATKTTSKTSSKKRP